jgi:uncharacterized protein
MDELSADQVIKLLGMQKHPEGGHYVETFRDKPADGSRGSCTAIYYLLQADEFSVWHRVDALTVSPNGHDAYATHLGPALGHGQKPQVVVPAGAWQTAVSLGTWALVGCTVSPAFEFAGFELAPPDWRPMPRPAGGSLPS